MVQSSFHVPATREIDLATVRRLLQEHHAPESQQEAFELILGALLEVQEHYGWVSRPAAEEVARHLHVPLARVYEILTFYGDFRLEPPGRHRVQVCNGTACFAMGTPAIQRALEAHYGIVAGETTPDGEVTFDLIPTCLGVCDLAPLGLFDGKYYPKLAPETAGRVADAAIRATREGEGHA
jgi:NADH-quinone oxidoreductase subunit E